MGEFDIVKIAISLVALLIAIIGHEIMHAVSALHYGDDTAKLMGRITLNPIKHIDPLGSIIIPLGLFLLQAPFLIGWAKPVPVDMKEVIRNGGYNGAIVVSLAGIVYNLLFAILAASILKSGLIGQNMTGFNGVIFYFLLQLMLINVVLAVFNLLPIPPLDGSQALAYACLKFKNRSVPMFFNRIEPYGMIIVIAILLLPSQINILHIAINLVLGLIL